MAKYRFRTKDGQMIGPLGPKETEELFKNSKTSLLEQVQEYPEGKWKKLTDFPELFDLLIKDDTKATQEVDSAKTDLKQDAKPENIDFEKTIVNAPKKENLAVDKTIVSSKSFPQAVEEDIENKEEKSDLSTGEQLQATSGQQEEEKTQVVLLDELKKKELLKKAFIEEKKIKSAQDIENKRRGRKKASPKEEKKISYHWSGVWCFISFSF